jgi:hypothetical protein
MIMRSRRGEDGVKDLFDLVAALRIRVAPYDEAQARIAIGAFRRKKSKDRFYWQFQ